VDEAVVDRRVYCRRCRYRFRVEAPARDGWRVEAQCPSCEAWVYFTADDTQEPPRPDPAELAAEAQRRGEVVWRSVNEHRDHPAVAWLDRVGNGLFEDDYAPAGWPVPH
jgi:hypothetical protein